MRFVNTRSERTVYDIIETMKILVLNKDLMERTVIQQVLQYNGHEIVPARDSETAMQLLREGEIRFIIADRTTTDIDDTQFIKQVRAAQPPYYIYILLITAKLQDGDITTPRTGADDYLHKPIVPVELKSRVHIGERILSLGDNLVRARDTFKTAAMFDSLTKVLNERAFLALSGGELERARRAQSSLSLVAFNIDNFASIKEHYGGTIPDDVLTVVAQGIREKSRPYDGLGRYGEHTFLLILPGVIGQDAEKIAGRILKGILNTEISLMDGTPVSVRLSAGIVSAVRITVSTEIETLIEQAKEALALAKRAEGEQQVHTVFV
ncbi:MAG TPA: diguanylate cyclase [Anaerolineales bacterium]|nr:diguanylate cyclase [Anaerolineales bacterium]